MELDWLEDFLALADTAHFSRAADKRNISQPAFSRRIKMLEEWMGTPLFDRATHRIELTSAGERWRPTAEDILRRVRLGREQVREAAAGLRSTLRFASTHALSITFFPRWLQSLDVERRLGAGVSLVTDNMSGCERKMLQGQANLLLCHHHPAAPVLFKPSYFVSVDIGRDALVPVSAPGPDGVAPLFALPGAAGTPLPYLAYGEGSGMGRILTHAFGMNGPTAWLATAFTSHVATVLAAMARSGSGVAWLPLSIVAADLDRGELLRAGGSEWDVPIDVRLYRARARQSPIVEEFWTIVKQMAGASRTAE